MNFWIGAAYDSHTYLDVIDSLRKIESRLNESEKAKEIQIKECESLKDEKQKLIESQSSYIKTTEKELNKESSRKSTWKGIGLGSLIANAVFILKEYIK